MYNSNIVGVIFWILVSIGVAGIWGLPSLIPLAVVFLIFQSLPFSGKRRRY